MSLKLATQTETWPAADAAAARIIEPPRFGRWLCLVAVALGLVWIAYQLLTNPGFQWDIVGRYMLDPTVLRGIAMTIQLTFLVMVIGAVIGVLVALMRMSRDPFLNFCAHGFVWFFRGTPVLVQLIFWYNLAALFPQLQLGIPFDGPKEPGQCMVTGKPSARRVVFARAY